MLYSIPVIRPGKLANPNPAGKEGTMKLVLSVYHPSSNFNGAFKVSPTKGI